MVKDKKVSVSIIDDAVRRILRKKFELGLFDNPFKFSDTERENLQRNNPENIAAARDIAKKSIVLLKNEPFINGKKILPLNKQIKNVALIGPFVKAVRDHLGFWSYEWPDDSSRIVSLWQGVQSKVANGTNLLYAKGCGINDADKSGFAEAIEVAKKSDVVILSVGEARDMTGEAKSRSNIGLPGVQEELVKAIMETGKPVVVLISAGRPLIFNWTADNVPAILYTWWLGIEAGNAIADVLYGDYNPAAKLPVSFPLSEGQIPIYYSHYNTGRPATSDSDRFYRSAYIDLSLYPRYSFGYGLSYTQFVYGNMQISDTALKGNQTLRVTIPITNTGAYDGEEVVQLYIRDLVATAVRPVKELKGFQKIFIKKGETKKVIFNITTESLKFYNNDLKYDWEPGEFEIMIGPNSREVKSEIVSWE